MEELGRQVVAVVAALLIAYLSRFLQPRSSLVHWFPAGFRFQVPVAGNPQAAVISSHALQIANVGREAAKTVEIIHEQQPQHFKVVQGFNFTAATNQAGQHVITIDSLAPRDWVMIQMLSVGTAPPNLLSIRSADGPSQRKQTRQVFVISKTRQWMFRAFVIIGLATLISWGWRLGVRYGPMLLAQ